MPLPDDEAQHLSRVLRLKVGDAVIVFDGNGREAMARVRSVTSRRVDVLVTDARSPLPEAVVPVMLAQALLKSDKMDRVIRDAVMLGVASIQPIISARIEVPRAALRAGGRQERWDRTVLSSVKQCGRAVVPPVLAPCQVTALFTRASRGTCLMFVEPSSTAAAAIVDVTRLEGPPPPEATVLIGPEGGWDPDEVKAAVAAGITLVTLGARVLRADAAGAAALAVLRYVWRDL